MELKKLKFLETFYSKLKKSQNFDLKILKFIKEIKRKTSF